MRGAPDRLRTEYLQDPLGIDTVRPRLSWWVNDPRPAELQTGYRIQAASSAEALAADAPDLWDTGQVTGGETIGVEYRGQALQPGTAVWWRVCCYDSDGTPSPWSRPARFEVGMPAPENWAARWIGAPISGSPITAVPAPVLYRDFVLPPAGIAAARLYLAVLGSAVAEINGRAVTEAEPFEPWTDLVRRVPYRVWDVTGHLTADANRLAVLLGDGDYCGHLHGGPRQRYGRRPALCAFLVIEHQDGHRETIGTDERWRWYPSWVLQGDREAGEEVDGRQFVPGWSRPQTEVGGAPAVVDDAAPGRFAQTAAPAAVSGILEPVSAPARRRLADGATRLRFDFGRTVLGRLRAVLEAPAGASVTVRYGDLAPGADASAGSAAVRWAPATDRYTTRGGGAEVFEPRFALHLYRFVEITIDRGLHARPEVYALEIASTAPAISGFDCDHRLLTDLFRLADRTLRLGLALGPVSALEADQRITTIADVQAILVGAAVCRDIAGAVPVWLDGLTIGEGGGSGRPNHEQPEPDDPRSVAALLLCLWLAYRCYGDRRLLERLFPSVQRALADIRQRWPELAAEGADGAATVREQMLTTAWYCYALSLAARMAGVLGRLADLESYQFRAERLIQAFRSRFVTRDGLLVADDALCILLALELGLLVGPERATAMRRLESHLRRNSFHLGVDVRHGALLLEVLTLEGRLDLAYQLLLQTTAPGWLHPLTCGAGVLWDEQTGTAGRLAAASVAGWLHRFLLGLELDDDLTPEVNAYRRMRIQPRPPVGPAFAAGAPVREASGHLDTVHGRYGCRWQLTDAEFALEVTIPANCSARVVLPDGAEHVVAAGVHRFTTPSLETEGHGAAPGDGADPRPEISSS